MLLQTDLEQGTEKRFHTIVNRYLKESDSAIIRPELNKKTASKPEQKIKLGDVVQIPENDITHIFNNQAMLAISHAIEDLASEQRCGELISTFQQLENFQPQKKRYIGLANDLDAVRVWGCGEIPKSCQKIDFIPIFRPELLKYWMVLYAGPEAHAVLVCRQVDRSDQFNNKIFAGFYSFNPFLVESVRRQFNLMSVGLDGIIHQWEKEFDIPTFSLKEIRKLFKDPDRA